jgi:hypothetical protein
MGAKCSDFLNIYNYLVYELIEGHDVTQSWDIITWTFASYSTSFISVVELLVYFFFVTRKT